MLKENKKLLKQILLLCAGAILLLIAASSIYVYVMLSRMQVNEDTLTRFNEASAQKPTPTYTPEQTYTPAPTVVEKMLQTPAPTPMPETNEGYGVINIAVFGMDNRYKNTIMGGRSDVIIILTIDKRNNEVRLSSFIRDTLIYIEPLNDYNRINAAIVFADGPQGAVECIEQEFSIDIDHYMVASFVSMSKIIDAIGGVDLYVSSAVAKNCNVSIKEMNPLLGYPSNANRITSSGNIHLNGIQAVAYMRQRKIHGGFARDDKQKEVLLEIRNKLKDMNIEEVNKLLTVVSENIKTDMEPMELIKVTMYLYACKDGDYCTLRIPMEDTYKLAWYKKMSIVQYDKDKNQPALYDFIYKGIIPQED